ncbi:MAG TPA: DUF4331 family protein [Casimicrobiaceae bacterium]|nr:DUF4331 family protein [Casimicrobiaceae bacterium]
MSDHFSGPRALADPAADLIDMFAFPAPGNPKNLVVVMDAFGKAGPSAVFSDAVIYRFRFRRARIAATGPDAAFAVDADEVAFDFTFDVPKGNEVAHPRQRAHYRTPGGETVSFDTNDERGGSSRDVRVFAGQRSEPFFLDVHTILETAETRQLAFKKTGSDTLYGTNVLAIVLEFEWAKLLGGGPMFAVVCETLRAGPRPVRIERLGRPEIKNVSMSFKMFDLVNRDLEIRDLYNSEDAFALMPDYVGAYRARLNANLSFWDSLDGKIDWPVDESGNHPLTSLLLADFLVVDVSRPFHETSYFEIEQAMLAGRPHATAGGRWLNEDVMDSIFTLYINGGNGPRINDGIDAPIVWSSKVFPYLAPPNPPKVTAR